MRKSILSLSAAFALGSMVAVTGAHAYTVVDQGGSTATGLSLHPAGTGHLLLTPYYTAQGGQGTFINIVNTDRTNGKVVKVRMRGAGNSDDLLDFQLFLSPSDVWTGMISADVSGNAQLLIGDQSCTIPNTTKGQQVPFSTNRLDFTSDMNIRRAGTREGYVEVYNMADVPPVTVPETGLNAGKAIANPLWAAIKASGSHPYKAKCFQPGDAMYDNMVNTRTNSGRGDAGLGNPTGGLFGNWSILNLQTLGAFSGDQTAIIATDSVGLGVNGWANSMPANINFFPQEERSLIAPARGSSGTPYPANGDLANFTFDPLLLGGIISQRANDLPDMSTPLIAGDSPEDQVVWMAEALAKPTIMNEWIATDAGAATPYSTDWVISQPTRRYMATVAYRKGNSGLASLPSADMFPIPVIWGDGALAALGVGDPFSPSNPYLNASMRDYGYGPQVCVDVDYRFFNREEANITNGGAFSPSDPAMCGEVSVLQFGDATPGSARPLNAQITAWGWTPNDPNNGAGWGWLTDPRPDAMLADAPNASVGMPILGYAATLFNMNGTNYGWNWPHRWHGTKALEPVPPALRSGE